MTATPIHLEHVLARKEVAAPDLENMNADELKRAARFWVGTTASNKMRKTECTHALAELFRDRSRVEAGLRSLTAKEQQVLAVVRRYGGAISGPLLQSELLTRKLVEKPKERAPHYGRQQTDDPVHGLSAKLLLVTPSGRSVVRHSYYSYSYRQTYPDLTLHPAALRDLVEPAALLSWKASAPASTPTGTVHRSAAQVALDLWALAQALGPVGSWKTNRGGALAKSMVNRLHKLLPVDERDPLMPPESTSLCYEVLRGIGTITVEENYGSIDLAAVARQLRHPGVVQAWHWVRAWLHAWLWQDGIGVVPDRDNYQDPVRIEPSKLHTARELLVWALCRVAHGDNDWLDLETFLIDLWVEAGQENLDFYWSSYSWKPKFAAAKGKEQITGDMARRRAYWLDAEGSWAANALLGTLVYLGLVERGGTGPDLLQHLCFRLTPIGQAVFRAPEGSPPKPVPDARFLTVQPNYEILAYLDDADARIVGPLVQMARRVSSASEHVQTFTLTRDSVYQALESGLTLEEIRRFLVEHSKTGVPENVARTVMEWGQKREALLLRTEVSLGVFPPGQTNPLRDHPKARPIGDRSVLLPRPAARGQRGVFVLDHGATPSPSWQIDDEGRVKVKGELDVVSRARLAQFAEPEGQTWMISAASIRRARERGLVADQVLTWLATFLTSEVPAVLETAISNWFSPAGVFLGDVLMLQVPQPQMCAMIRAASQFQPLLLGHLAPNWFLVRPDRRAELERLLQELGFAVGASYKLREEPEEGTSKSGSGRAGRGRRARTGRHG